MAIFNANILMKELRTASGLSQADAAEGICARQTLSAIERGTRKPDWFTFSNVLKKYKVDPTNYYSDIASEDEIYIYNQLSLGNKLIGTFDFDGIKAEIEKMEQDKRFETGLGYQTLVGFKTLLYSQDKYKDMDKAYHYCYEYIHIFRPNFNIDDIPQYFLSDNDFKMINRLSTVYLNKGDIDTTLKIRYNLIENYEKKYNHDIGNSLRDTYIITLNNLAYVLLQFAEQYENAIAVADKGMALITGVEDNPRIFFRFMLTKGFALHALGHQKGADQCFKRCLLFSLAMGENVPKDMSTDFVIDAWHARCNERPDFVDQLLSI